MNDRIRRLEDGYGLKELNSLITILDFCQFTDMRLGVYVGVLWDVRTVLVYIPYIRRRSLGACTMQFMVM